LEAAFGNLENLWCIPETTVRYVLPRHKVANWGELGMLSAIAAAQRASPVPTTPRRQAWGKLMARVGEEFPLECPACGGDIRLIVSIAEPGPIRKILTHLGEPLERPPLSPARGPPTECAEFVQVHHDRDIFQSSPDGLPVIDIHSL
jgi:hypothetical protein